jgi:hypothetical protein
LARCAAGFRLIFIGLPYAIAGKRAEGVENQQGENAFGTLIHAYISVVSEELTGGRASPEIKNPLLLV